MSAITVYNHCDNFSVAKQDFPGGPVVKNPPANAGDPGSVPGLGRFRVQWGNQAHALQLLKPTRSRALALQQEKPLQ